LARRGLQLELAEQTAKIGSWEWNGETRELLWSDNLFRLLGLEPGEIAPRVEYVLERAHPDDRAALKRAVGERLNGSSEQLAYRIIRRDGEVRHLRTFLGVDGESDGRPVRLFGLVHDVTEARRASREIAAHIAVSEALTEWESLEQSGAALLGKLGGALELEVGTLWLPEGDVLAAHAFWQRPLLTGSELESVTRGLRLPGGVGLPGEVWQKRQPINVVRLQTDLDPARHPHAARCHAAVRAGLRGAVALPAVHADEVLAVLDFYSREEAELTDRLMRSLTGIGYELGRFLARRRGELQPQPLTPRELEVLRLAAHGHSGPEIAARLVVSPATIKTHFENTYAKLEVSDRASAVAKALRLGLMS
jgi:PAS domain S-box-containing protein